MSIAAVRFWVTTGVFSVTLFSFPIFERSIRAYHKTLIYTLSHFSEYHLHSMTPNVGEESVPAMALSVRELVKQHQLPSYKLSVEYSKEGWTYQQTVVSLWPIQLKAESPNLFMLLSEATPQNCNLTTQTKEIKLVHCR
jgi:hypothetical protein